MSPSSTRCGRNIGEVLRELGLGPDISRENSMEFRKRIRCFVQEVRESEPHAAEDHFRNEASMLASTFVEQCNHRFFLAGCTRYTWPLNREVILPLVAEILQRQNMYFEENSKRKKSSHDMDDTGLSGSRKRVCSNLDANVDGETIEVRFESQPDGSVRVFSVEVPVELTQQSQTITISEQPIDAAHHRSQSSHSHAVNEQNTLRSNANFNHTSAVVAQLDAQQLQAAPQGESSSNPKIDRSIGYNVPITEVGLSNDLVIHEPDEIIPIDQTGPEDMDDGEETDGGSDQDYYDDRDKMSDNPQPQSSPAGKVSTPTKTYEISVRYHGGEYNLSGAQCAKRLRLTFAHLDHLTACMNLANVAEHDFDFIKEFNVVCQKLERGIQETAQTPPQGLTDVYTISISGGRERFLVAGDECAKMIRLATALLECLSAKIRLDCEMEKTFDAKVRLNRVLGHLEDYVRQSGKLLTPAAWTT